MSAFYQCHGDEERGPDGSVIVYVDGTRFRILPQTTSDCVVIERWEDQACVTVGLREYVELGFSKYAPMFAQQFVHAFRTRWDPPNEEQSPDTSGLLGLDK